MCAMREREDERATEYICHWFGAEVRGLESGLKVLAVYTLRAVFAGG
jgi:hypothetical protein